MKALNGSTSFALNSMHTSMPTNPEPSTSPWPSILALIGFLAAMGGLISKCHGTTYRITWDEPTDAVDHWIAFGPGDLPLALATSPSVSIEAEPLTPITVVAVDADGRMSEPSEVCYLPPALGPVRVTLQAGDDLTGWSDVATVYRPKKQSEFFRLKIETP